MTPLVYNCFPIYNNIVSAIALFLKMFVSNKCAKRIKADETIWYRVQPYILVQLVPRVADISVNEYAKKMS